MLRNPILSIIKTFLSRMRSKGSRFTLGFWGLRVCSLDIAYMFATVRIRTRPQPFACGHMAVWPCLYCTFCQRDHFWMFPASRSWVSRGRHGTLWHSDVFRDVSTIVLCGRGSNTLATFSQDELQFSCRAQHCGCVHRHFAWRCCVFFANRIVRAASSGDMQIPWQVWYFVRCDEKWRKLEASHETSILW